MITRWTQAIQIENLDNFLFIFKWIVEFEFCVIVTNVVAVRKVTFIHGLILWVGGEEDSKEAGGCGRENGGRVNGEKVGGKRLWEREERVTPVRGFF